MAEIPILLTIAACFCAVLLAYCVVLLRRIDRGVEAVRILLYHDYDGEIRHKGIYAEPNPLNARMPDRRSA